MFVIPCYTDWYSVPVFEFVPVSWPYVESDIRAEIPELVGVGVGIGSAMKVAQNRSPGRIEAYMRLRWSTGLLRRL